jgi:hypothetical protein
MPRRACQAMRHQEEEEETTAKAKPNRNTPNDDSDTSSSSSCASSVSGKEEPPKKKKKRGGGGAAVASTSQQQQRRERSKSVNTVAARMKQVVEHMVASYKAGELHPNLTIFQYKSPQSEIINAFFNELQRENRVLFHSRDEVLALIARRYDEFVAGAATT